MDIEEREEDLSLNGTPETHLTVVVSGIKGKRKPRGDKRR
jgi:hypothetical protein